MDIRCGLLGRSLSHSYSPQIHRELGAYPYRLFELEETEIPVFLKRADWTGINVTIPYKKTVYPYMDEVSPASRRIRSVNTVIRRPDGSLYGDITDVYGFTETVRKSGVCVSGKQTLVLGSGGASAAVCAALEALNAPYTVISRRGENNYENIDKHAGARIIVNATPVGMYPKNGEAPLDLSRFPQLEGVFDLIYNPARTALILQAGALGIPAFNGLYMLVAQAARSAELFTGGKITDETVERVYNKLAQSMRNIVLIGMPGCGKSTLGAEIAALTGREFYDSDAEITRLTGRKPSEIIRADGEAAFRDTESGVLRELGKRSACVIATGGGAVLRSENYAYLRQNGVVVWLKRELDALDDTDRPLLDRAHVRELYAVRPPLYTRFADISTEITGDADVSARRVLATINEYQEGRA